jgi:hypothetical protein
MLLHSRRGHPEAGFALPSVLFLVTVLGIIAASLLALGFLRKKEALSDVARLKARYAAQSGVVRVSSEIERRTIRETDLWQGELSYEFDGGRAKATVRIRPWGMFYRVESVGQSLGAHHELCALLGAATEGDLSQALLYAHRSHQLVLTGDVKIRGDVTTGNSGITIGTLRDYSTPLQLPVEGQVQTIKGVKLPPLRSAPLERHLSVLRGYLIDSLRADEGRVMLHGSQDIRLLPESINDDVHSIVLDVSTTTQGDFPDRTKDLTVIVQGDLTLHSSTRMRGNYCLVATGPITVDPGARIEGGIIISLKTILIRAGSDLSVQCVAPVIKVEENSRLRYPSVLYAMDPSGVDTTALTLDVKPGSVVEGMLALSTTRDGELSSNLLRIHRGARVTGVVYSTTRIESDGDIMGSVLTNDFYFYEEPTTYLGWLKRGSIDRVNLPAWYSAPIGVGEGEVPMTVVQWN